MGNSLFIYSAVTNGKSCFSKGKSVCVYVHDMGEAECVMENQTSLGKVDVRDSKAFGTFLLGFKFSV